MILLTDGKEEAPETRIIEPHTALEIAKAKGVKVYCIGMASIAPVVVREKGKTTRSDPLIDEALLRRIAAQTGGQYFRATDKESLQQIYRQIDRLEKSQYDVVTNTRVEERFLPFLLASLFFIILELFLRYIFLRTFP